MEYSATRTACIPEIDIAALFGEPSPARECADAAIMAAATSVGFFVARGLPSEVPLDAGSRADLLRIFQLPEPELRLLWRQKFDASHANVYRGWFPLQTGFLTSKEGIDMGADVAHGASRVLTDDPLCEATPLPPEVALPGWRAAAARYYRAMEHVSQALMRALARGLTLPERYFDQAFDRGLSTLRMIRYPVRSDLDQAARANPDFWVTHQGSRFHMRGTAHVDSGFLTLLAQDGVAGLQALPP